MIRVVHRALVALVAFSGLAAIDAPLGAQSAPPVTAPKRAAMRAVDAVNARTAAQTSGQEGTAAGGAAQRGSARSTASQAALSQAALSQAAPSQSAATAARDSANDGTQVMFTREIFHYDDGGRRDPFVSLLASGELRPLLQDLKLVGVVYDPTGRRPIAVMRDVTTKDQYRVTVGQQLGRMRVTQIQPKSVIFTIEEFGYSRQEVLALGDSTGARTP